MTVQRYGLAHPDRYIKLCGCKWHRLLVWFAGICLYGVANGLKVTAFNLGPFSVLGSVFTVVLIFNLGFARWLLRERITWPKVVSSATILVGAIICTIGAPAEVKTVFTPSDISTLFAGHVGFVTVLTVLMCACLVGVVYVECSYPMTAEVRAAKTADKSIKDAADAGVRLPPRWVDKLMALVYPGSLGFDESLADLLIRAWTAMTSACTGGVCDAATGAAAMCDVPVVYGTIGFWVLLSFGGSLIWMPVVYKRYEVSTALPIEYGALNACTVLSGLLFYDEHQFMHTWQVVLQAERRYTRESTQLFRLPSTLRGAYDDFLEKPGQPLLLGGLSLLVGFYLAGSLSTIFGAAGFWEPTIAFGPLVVTELITRRYYSRPMDERSQTVRLLNALKVGFYLGVVIDALKLAG